MPFTALAYTSTDNPTAPGLSAYSSLSRFALPASGWSSEAGGHKWWLSPEFDNTGGGVGWVGAIGVSETQPVGPWTWKSITSTLLSANTTSAPDGNIYGSILSDFKSQTDVFSSSTNRIIVSQRSWAVPGQYGSHTAGQFTGTTNIGPNWGFSAVANSWGASPSAIKKIRILSVFPKDGIFDFVFGVTGVGSTSDDVVLFGNVDTNFTNTFVTGADGGDQGISIITGTAGNGASAGSGIGTTALRSQGTMQFWRTNVGGPLSETVIAFFNNLGFPGASMDDIAGNTKTVSHRWDQYG